MKKILQVEALVYNEKRDEILIVRKRDLTWGFPGGKVEINETMEESLVKKIKSQTNIEITVDRLLFCKERRTEWEHICTFVFRSNVKGNFLPIKNDDSVFQVKWLPVPTVDNLINLENISLNKLILDQGILYESRNEFPVN